MKKTQTHTHGRRVVLSFVSSLQLGILEGIWTKLKAESVHLENKIMET